MYPAELEIKDTTESNTSASYLDLLLSIGRHGQLRTSLYDKRDDFNFHITNVPFLSSNIPSSPAYGVFISQLIRYARACSSYECFILRAVRLSNKLLGQGYLKERIKSSLSKFYCRTGILSNNMRPPFPECYTTFWIMTIYSELSIDEALHQCLPLLLIWTLLPNLTFCLIARGLHRTFATGAACQQRTHTPPDTWSCPTLGLASILCWDLSLLNLSCFRTFEFRTPLGISILLLIGWFGDRWARPSQGGRYLANGVSDEEWRRQMR